MSVVATHRPLRRRLPVVAGVGYSLAWVAGLSVASSSTQVRSSGAAVLADVHPHLGAVAVQYLLTEGLAGVLLGLVVWTVAGCADATDRGRELAWSGLAAATVSVVQFVIGLWLVRSAQLGDVGRVGASYTTLNRLDGVKMLLLAAYAVATAVAIRGRTLPLPRWLGYAALALAVSITVSGIGYLVLDDTLAVAAWVSLPCLLVVITGSALALGTADRTG